MTLRSVYSSVFKAWGILPGALARQDPILLFDTLAGIDSGASGGDETGGGEYVAPAWAK